MATLTGAVLGVLGIAATVVAVVSGLRIGLRRKDVPAGPLSAKSATVPAAAGAATGDGHRTPASHGGAGAYGPRSGPPSPYAQGGQAAWAGPGPSAYPQGGQAAWAWSGPAAAPHGEKAAQPGQSRTKPTPAGLAIGIAALAVVAVAAFLFTWPWIDGLLAPKPGAGGAWTSPRSSS
ncbi:hypothetical protein [Nonomuraea sp. NPDC049309]|uniref:hypothetical protein n=1 Tax=Nonomuraea sp. NPDC049309 TaxID=3364350 RepID=UPI003714BA23